MKIRSDDDLALLSPAFNSRVMTAPMESTLS